MELRHLITLKTIVEKGGFKKAAEHLGYAQSSVTAHIKELEAEIGKPVFDRLGKKVVLTHYGEQFLPYALKIIELYDQALTTDNEPTGDLTLGVSESLMIHRVPSLLVEYKKVYRNVNLSLKTLDFQDIMACLQTGEIDIALVLESDGWKLPELHCEQLMREKMVIISPTLEKKLELGAVLYTERSCGYKAVFNEYIHYKKLKVKESLEFQSIEAIKQCVRSGLGISMVPYFSVQEELESHKLIGEEVESDLTAVSTYLAYHKDKWLSPSMKSMISLIKKHAKEWM
ncbi:LysR family transcriptional regulator [Paenibacillus terrae HPL-003]|uniref:LysR family transcriptional regulator n=1 Tax=Paenibacillus terrae (strain HPL-003) TaxID=985665 RepID=G7VT83_PAETH|nr:LysR family transcriptional regulator [Paenibacillus terrae]AET57498.1 LysR family transcriptional regulator [Paenibacillus terrae HPL-003]